MAIDPFSSPPPKQDKQQPTQPQQDDPNVFLDLLAAPFRGLEGAVEGVYNLADMVTFDALPDYDMSFLTGRKRLLGTSETVAGGMAEGITQFLTGFIPFFGWASKAGKVAKAGSLTQKALGGPVRAGIAAGMASDFTVFDGQEARLSNLIQEFPELQNPVTEFLAASDDDPEAIGRFKNVLEGLGLEFAVGGLIAGLRGLKKGRNKRIETDDPDLTNQAVAEALGDGSELVLSVYKDAHKGAHHGTPLDIEDVDDALDNLKGAFDIADTEPYKLIQQGTNAKSLLESVRDLPDSFVKEQVEEGGVNWHFSSIFKNQQKVIEEILRVADPEELEGIKVRAGGLTSKESLGEYHYDIDEIRFPSVEDVMKDPFRGTSVPSIIHEVIHGLTSRKIESATKGLKELTLRLKNQGQEQLALVNYFERIKGLSKDNEALKPIRNLAESLIEARKHLGEFEDYGVTNLDELLAEAFSNSEFQKKLASIKLKNNRTMWQVVVDSVKDLLGLKNIDNTLLDKVLREGSDIISMKRGDVGAKTGAVVPSVKPTAATTPEVVDLSTKEGRRQRMEDWVRDAWQKKREEALKAAGKNPEDMPAGWEDTALKRVSEDIRAGNNTPDWMDTRELADTLPSTLDRETGEKLDFENEAWPRTGTLLDFLEGQEFSRIPDDIDTPTLKVEPEAPRPVSDDVRKVIDDAFENTNDELERGRLLNKIQLENSDDIDEVRKYVRTKVEDTLPDPGKKTLEEQKLEAYEAIADVSEETAKNWKGQIDILDTIGAVRQARLEAQVFKDVSRGLGEKLTALIKDLQAGGGDAVKAKIKNVLQEAFEFEAHYSALGREFSLGLGGRRISGRNRKIGLNESEIANEGIRNRYLNESDFDKIVEKLKAGTSGEDLDVTVKKLLEMSKRTQGGKLNMLREYWINSILSGLRTQAVNALGNGFTTIFSTLEAAVGGIATGNIELTKVAITSLFDFEMYKEAAKMGWKTATDGENFLDPDFRAFDEPGRREAITPENLGMQQGDNGYEVVDKLGKFFRLPSRGLMATDEFFKQLNYRRTARIKATMDGIKQGITDPQDLAKYVTDRVQSVIRDGGQHYSQETLIREGTRLADEQGLKGKDKTKFINKHVTDNWDEDASALAEYAVDEARYLTFTGELQKGTLGNTIQTVVRNHPLASFILPFIRTPLNILKYAFERTPGVVLMKNERQKLFSELKSDDPTIKAQAVGRLATSTTVTGQLLMLGMGWGPNLTGGGPRDPKQKEALQATGWRPYSIKIGNQYISYQRLDPFATMLGVVTDIRDTALNDDAGFKSSAAEEMFAAAVITFQRNVTNKSYLAGLQMFTDAMSDTTGNKMERLIRNLSSSMIPMSGFMSQIQYWTGTQEQRELRSIVDGLMHKTPYMRDKLDPKRNLLGEAYMIENVPFIGAINPIAHSTDKNDPVFNELAKLGHAFRQPPSTYNGIIDLLEFTTDSGQTAHDRRLELLQTTKVGGRTLRQALERLIKSRKYQRLSDQSEPGLPSPRISEINKILRKYRTKALDRTITEFPELQNYYRRVTRAKKQFNQGADYTDILTLLQ